MLALFLPISAWNVIVTKSPIGIASIPASSSSSDRRGPGVSGSR
jgi:hypothetical protein